MRYRKIYGGTRSSSCRKETEVRFKEKKQGIIRPIRSRAMYLFVGTNDPKKCMTRGRRRVGKEAVQSCTRSTSFTPRHLKCAQRVIGMCPLQTYLLVLEMNPRCSLFYKHLGQLHHRRQAAVPSVAVCNNRSEVVHRWS